MLSRYLSDTRLLLNDSSSQIFPDSELTGYINRARAYTASLGECVRSVGHTQVTSPLQGIFFSDVVPTGIQLASKLINVRSIVVEGGFPVEVRPYEWVEAYIFPVALAPTRRVAGIYRQGYRSGTAGSIGIKSGLAVTLPYTIAIDGIWLPIALVDDSTAEDIPDLWGETICYYTAYLAYMRVQRQADAIDMLQAFNEKMTWAREAVTSSRLPGTTDTIGGPGTHEAATYGALNQPPRSSG